MTQVYDERSSDQDKAILDETPVDMGTETQPIGNVVVISSQETFPIFNYIYVA